MQSFEIPEKPLIQQHRPQDLRKYSIVPIRAANDRRIRPAAMRVLLTVCSYANRAGLCWPSHENVGKALGVSRQAAGRQIRKLRDMGYLKVVKNHSHGKTAQILRVIYDETLSNSGLMDSIKFEDLPPTLQAWQERKTTELLNQGNETVNTVALTAEKNERSYLSVDEVMSMWRTECNKAGIVRIVTSEDRQVAVSMCTAGVSRESFERVLSQVFEDWQQYRREPPHRLAWFAQRLSAEPTPCPPAPARTDVGT
jgi:biotin operon repressor